MPSPSEAYLAFDLGAESGRAVLGRIQSGVITMEELHRFSNEPVEYADGLHWDAPRLWFEVCRALALIKEVPLQGVGVDAWGVDYALLGEQGELLANPYHYRDKRTEGVMDLVFEKVGRPEIYRETGIQFMPINTLYQLFAAQRNTPNLLRAARKLVTIPDLFHYWMTGNAVAEFTNATTTQMVNPHTHAWSQGLLQALELPCHLLAELVEPGTVVGTMLRQLRPKVELPATPVIAPASHDTGSAVAAISAREDTAFLSSGTWSLLGIELTAPLINAEALRLNFTNEGGVCGTTRFLKNVMGLWMLQGCRQAWSLAGKAFSYGELMELAAQEPAFNQLVDPDDESFLHPTSMPNAIDRFCDKTEQRRPQTPGGYVRTVMESLAFKYRLFIEQLERLTGRPISQIRVVGGGSKNRLLNQFTADATGRTVLAGPSEATALGNIAIQILATGALGSLAEARSAVDRSFATETFKPQECDRWQQHWQRFQHYVGMVYA